MYLRPLKFIRVNSIKMVEMIKRCYKNTSRIKTVKKKKHLYKIYKVSSTPINCFKKKILMYLLTIVIIRFIGFIILIFYLFIFFLICNDKCYEL